MDLANMGNPFNNLYPSYAAISMERIDTAEAVNLSRTKKERGPRCNPRPSQIFKGSFPQLGDELGFQSLAVTERAKTEQANQALPGRSG